MNNKDKTQIGLGDVTESFKRTIQITPGERRQSDDDIVVRAPLVRQDGATVHRYIVSLTPRITAREVMYQVFGQMGAFEYEWQLWAWPSERLLRDDDRSVYNVVAKKGERLVMCRKPGFFERLFSKSEQ